MVNQFLKERLVEKITWAVDAFEEKTELYKQAVQILSYCQQQNDVVIEPVFILSLSEFSFPYSAGPEWIPQAKQSAERNLKYLVSQYNIPCLTTPKVLVHLSRSSSEAAAVLADYARDSGSDLILVRSHSRQGLQRFFLGSFAENILHRSEVPVMVIGAKNKALLRIKHILIPSDFQAHSKDIFRKAIPFAKQLGAKISLFHAIPQPDEPFLDFDYHSRLYQLQGEYVSMQTIFEHEVDHQTRRSQAWAAWAQHEGVATEPIIDSSGHAIDRLIIDFAEKNSVDLIMMESKTGPLQTALLGSHTRKVLRAASCPVFVFTKDFYKTHLTPQKNESFRETFV